MNSIYIYVLLNNKFDIDYAISNYAKNIEDQEMYAETFGHQFINSIIYVSPSIKEQYRLTGFHPTETEKHFAGYAGLNRIKNKYECICDPISFNQLLVLHKSLNDMYITYGSWNKYKNVPSLIDIVQIVIAKWDE